MKDQSGDEDDIHIGQKITLTYENRISIINYIVISA
jgi:hypothetical protein